MRRWIGAGLVGVLSVVGAAAAAPAAHAGQYAIVLQAGTEGHEGMARALHAFLYAKELREHNHEVVLIFDGAGTQWAAELADPASESKLKPLYDEMLSSGAVELICDYCAAAFGVRGQLADGTHPLVGEYAGHPSIAKWANQGYELIVL